MISLQRNKRAGADLLVELVLSTIIFFIIVFFIFSVNIPKQELKACARVVSADATLACETSLNNLMRATSPEGINYADWLMKSWLNNNVTDWSRNVSSIMRNVFEQGNWKLQVFLPNGTSITGELGKITTNQFGCNYTAPFTAALLQKYCSYYENKETSNKGVVIFNTPDNTVTFNVEDDASLFGLSDCTNCGFSDFESKMQNNTNKLNVITIPVRIKGYSYDLMLEELKEGSYPVNATLTRSSTLQDCGLTVFLLTMNTTNEEQICCQGGACTKVTKII